MEFQHHTATGRFIVLTRRNLEPFVTSTNELLNLLRASLGVTTLKRSECRTHDNRSVLAIEVVGRKKITHLHVDELEHLLVGDHVDLVDEDDELLNANLTSEKKMLPGLGHLAVRGRDHNDSTVHLSRTGNHILDICDRMNYVTRTSWQAGLTIGVTWAVDVAIMAALTFVLDVSRVDSDATGLLLRRFVNLRIVGELSRALLSEDPGNGSGQRGLAVVDVACFVACRYEEKAAEMAATLY